MRATDFSRRTFLKHAAAGSAASLPAVAMAAPERHIDPAPLTDEQQMNACIAQLETILARMHPAAKSFSNWYSPRQDGTFRVFLACKRDFLPWTGPVLYRISDDGCLLTFWLEKVEEKDRSGKVYGHVFLANMWLEDERRFLGEIRRYWQPCIVEKLEWDMEPSDDA